MKKQICPFCWNKNIRCIDDIKDETNNISRFLMECDSCEKYFWGDTGEKVKGLSNFCQTFLFKPEKCIEDVRNHNSLKNFNYSRRKLEELDLLCSTCPNRKFLLNYEMSGKKTIKKETVRNF